MNTLIAPSLLASDFSNIADQIRQVEQGGADWLHLDIMDGHFVPNITFGPPVVQSIRKCTQLTLDTHLMIEEPELFIGAFRDAGADIITVHQETCRHLHRIIGQIKDTGAKAGVCVNPATPVSTLKEIVGDVDLILIMTVNPGFGGQTFINSCIKKIEECAQLIQKSGRPIYLQVDGGIDKRTAPLVIKAGANVLVAGTSIFHANNIAEAIKSLRA